MDHGQTSNLSYLHFRPVSAFELWLSENQEDLQEEHPELSQEELSRIAAEKFRSLPREERQVKQCLVFSSSFALYRRWFVGFC